MRFLPVVILVSAVGAAEACPSFGLTSPYLSEYFCGQLDDIAAPRTRAVTGADNSSGSPGDTVLTQPDPEWMYLPLVQEAWRSDPAKTLKLIERIREAGGRPLK